MPKKAIKLSIRESALEVIKKYKKMSHQHLTGCVMVDTGKTFGSIQQTLSNLARNGFIGRVTINSTLTYTYKKEAT